MFESHRGIKAHEPFGARHAGEKREEETKWKGGMARQARGATGAARFDGSAAGSIRASGREERTGEEKRVDDRVAWAAHAIVSDLSRCWLAARGARARKRIRIRMRDLKRSPS